MGWYKVIGESHVGINFFADQLRRTKLFMELNKGQRASVIGGLKRQDQIVSTLVFLNRKGIVKISKFESQKCKPDCPFCSGESTFQASLRSGLIQYTP